MAKKEDLNLNTDDAAEEKSGGKGKLIIIIVLVLVVLGGGAGAYFFLMAGDAPADGEGEPVAEVVEEPQEPIYFPLKDLVVNLQPNHLLKAEMQVMAYDQEIIEKVKLNMPAIRNRLIMLFSTQDFPPLKTLEGKEALRQDALSAINDTLKLTPEEGVQDLFFDNLLLQ